MGRGRSNWASEESYTVSSCVCFKSESLLGSGMKKLSSETQWEVTDLALTSAPNPNSCCHYSFFVCLFGLLKTQFVSEDDFELLNLVHLPSAGTAGVCGPTQLPGPSFEHSSAVIGRSLLPGGSALWEV